MSRDIHRRAPVLDRRRRTTTATGRARPLRVGVVLPVHDEERLLATTLTGLGQALARVGPAVADWRVAIVLDRCTDGSAAVVGRWMSGLPDSPGGVPVEVMPIDAGNVGTARRTGCDALLRHWSDVPPASVWLATTDGDSEVPPTWLSSQIRHRHRGAEVWVGRVAVGDWSDRTGGLSEEWRRQYADEHLPVHGANLGFDGATYLRLGGFEDRATGEDRALVGRALDHGCVIHHDRSVTVSTSSRRVARAPGGFAHALDGMEAALAWSPPDVDALATSPRDDVEVAV